MKGTDSPRSVGSGWYLHCNAMPMMSSLAARGLAARAAKTERWAMIQHYYLDHVDHVLEDPVDCRSQEVLGCPESLHGQICFILS